ncbi:MAG: coaE, partial [Acidimicrobiia bacterium]|nr:coaE [Acidimicrobiia bacterium]
MIVVGLTGGIGSGKSTVSAALAERGAVVVDADAITRELQQPGQPVLLAIAERFGAQVLQSDGSLDRPALAAIVFSDSAALADLNGIVHPMVRKEIAARLAAQEGTDRVVVLDVPLLVESKNSGTKPAAVIVVDTPPDVAVARLVAHRGFSEADARARIASQASREDRLAAADRVVDNGGSIAELMAQLDALWAWISTLPH